MAFESGVVPEDWRSAVILVDRICRVNGGLIDDEQGGGVQSVCGSYRF